MAREEGRRGSELGVRGHPDVDLKSKETVSCCAILVGCIESSAHPVADLKLRHHASNQRLREATRNKKQLDFGFLLKGGGGPTRIQTFRGTFQ